LSIRRRLNHGRLLPRRLGAGALFRVGGCWSRRSGKDAAAAPAALELPITLVLQPTRFAEIMQEVDGMVFHHASQLDKALVRLRIGIEDSLRNLFGLFNDLGGRQHPHARDIGVKPDQT